MLAVSFTDPIKTIKLTFSETTSVSAILTNCTLFVHIGPAKDMAIVLDSFKAAVMPTANNRNASYQLDKFLSVTDNVMKLEPVMGEVRLASTPTYHHHEHVLTVGSFSRRHFRWRRLRSQPYRKPTLSVTSLTFCATFSFDSW